MKSCFGDILDKNTADRKKKPDVNIKILSEDAKQFLKIPISNKVPQKAVLSIGVLIMLKKLNFHVYYRVFVKDKKIAYFEL